MKRNKIALGFLWLLGALVLSAPSAHAQAVSGTILGSVADPSGATVAGARITLTQPATGFTRTVVSDAGGEFIAPSLPVGIYNISAEMAGFKRAAVTNLQLGVDQKARLDLKLEIGAASESVEIQGAAPLVQTDSSDLSGTINERQIVNLPLNGRNFVALTRTLPGVQRGIPGANIDGAGSLAWRASASFAANGMRTRDNNFMLDGVDNNETWLNSVVIFPSVDALEEFKVQTSTYSAEFGRSSGGVVNIQIKSGQNAFHGSAFEFLRNNKLDSNDFFNNRNRRNLNANGKAQTPPFKQNQFGGTAGGRIRRDKTFFFGDYQGTRIRDSKTYLSNVPTLKMRAGDFSELTNVIYNPLTNQPYTGNIIPAAQFDPAAKKIIDDLYPLPNVAGTRAANGQTINNFIYNPVLQREDDQFDGKIDNYFSANNHFFGRYSFERTHRFLPASIPHGDAGFTFGAGNGLVRAQSLALNDTHTFSPSWLNELRFGFSRIGFKVTSIDAGTNLAQSVGIPGVNITDTATAMSQIAFNPAQEIRHLGANGNQPLLTFLDTFQIFDNVTHTRGAHTIKLGASLTRRRRNIFNVDTINGTFTFGSTLTSNCAGATGACTVNPNTGFTLATFLLGFPTTVTRGLQLGVTGERRPEYGAYVQDDWRVNSKLTVNIGLRYDVFVPYVEVNNRQSNFDTSTGKFVVASDDAVINGIKVGRALQTTPKKDFAPRLGFAYDVFGGGKTVVRGGYGIFWNNPLTGTSSSKPSNPPFLLSNALTQQNPFLPTLRLRDGVPAPPSVNPNAAPTGTTRSIFDPNFRDGYAQQWNLNLSQQFGKDYALELTYVGSKGTDLVVKGDINQAPPVVGVTNANTNRPFRALAPGLLGLSQVQSRGYSNHHALLAKFSNRFSNGLAFVNSYTFGKTIDIVSDTEGTVQNYYNFNRDRAVSDFDIKHNFTSSWSYDLPWGKGKLLGGGVNSVVDKFIGGWQLSGILLMRTGLPFTVSQSTGVQSTGTGNRPNRLASGKLDNPTIDRWFDLNAFQPTNDPNLPVGVRDATGTYGNSGRNILRGPGQVNMDLSLVKNTRFKERFEHQFKVEFFNALNHAQFANPAATIGTGSAGTITSLLFGSTARQIQVAMKLKF